MPIARQGTPLDCRHYVGQSLQQADKNKPAKVPSGFANLGIIPKPAYATRRSTVVPKRQRSPNDITLNPRNHSAPPLSTPNYFTRTQPNGPIELIFTLPAWPPAKVGKSSHQVHRVSVPDLTLADVHAHIPAYYPLLLPNIRMDLEAWYDHIHDLAAKKDLLWWAEATLTSIKLLAARLDWVATVCAQIKELNERIRKVMANALAGTDKSGPRATIYDGDKLHEFALTTPLPEVYDDIDTIIAERLVTAAFLFEAVQELLKNFVNTARAVPSDLISKGFVQDNGTMFDNVNALCRHIQEWGNPLQARIRQIKLLEVSWRGEEGL